MGPYTGNSRTRTSCSPDLTSVSLPSSKKRQAWLRRATRVPVMSITMRSSRPSSKERSEVPATEA
uniref:Uncharacterized protein n=1 Tax=Triticum urartu TaxID=4572 RepID=A0A8R7P1F3_TRIUA